MNLIGIAVVILAGSVATLSSGPPRDLGSFVVLSGLAFFILEIFELRPHLTRRLHSVLGIGKNDRGSAELENPKGTYKRERQDI